MKERALQVGKQYQRALSIGALFALAVLFFYVTLIHPNFVSSQTTRYYIDYSLQFTSASSRYFTKNFDRVGSTTIWTFSAWVKRDTTGVSQTIMAADTNSSNYTWIGFFSDNKFMFSAAGTGGSADKRTTATYTSTSAWYHVVVAVDTSQGTAANRNRIYVDGTEITSFSTNTNLGSGVTTHMADNNDGANNAVTHRIGVYVAGSYFNGLMAEAILVDGQQLTPSSFGYDDGGTWRPKEFVGATTTGSGFVTNGPYGTNGFRLDFMNSNGLGQDRSGRGNDFAPVNIASAQQSTTTPTGSLNRSSADNFKPSGETYFTDNVVINGGASIDYNLSKGAGSFVIDHPLDPKNKLLYHSFVESPDAKNIYDGMVELNGSGEATISLPGYFLALNEDFRYLATPIGVAMPRLHLSMEVRRKWFGLFGEPVFKLSGGAPNGKVSWEVTGIRHDLFARTYPIRTEVEKGPDELVEKGEYVHPHLYQR